jgi:uncharacterized protein
MRNKKEKIKDVFILPVDNYYLIYSPLRNISALSNKLTVNYLYDVLIQKNLSDEKRHPISFILDRIENTPLTYPTHLNDIPDPYFLGLIPTRACNGNCMYCGFVPDIENEIMNYGTAVRAIDWMVERIKTLKKQKLEIHFFGGEPLFAPDVVTAAVLYAKMTAIKNKLIPHFEISTNGLVNQELSRFVSDHFNSVVLSLDGFKDIHNYQRPMHGKGDSFALAVRFAKEISRSNAELCIRTCISSKNLIQMPEITEWFCQEFIPSSINFEILKPNKKTLESNITVPDPFDFVRQYNSSYEIAEKYGVNLSNSAIGYDSPQFSSCPVGKDTLIVSSDGKISSCYLQQERWEEKGLDLSVGDISLSEMNISERKILDLRKLVEDKPRCASCYMQWTCAGGCHVDTTYPGSDMEYDNYCLQTRILGLVKILRNLNQQSILSNLLADREQLRKIATMKSDKLGDFSYED